MDRKCPLARVACSSAYRARNQGAPIFCKENVTFLTDTRSSARLIDDRVGRNLDRALLYANATGSLFPRAVRAT
jgi:hypothetical protein